jgi:hypothetical protein
MSPEGEVIVTGGAVRFYVFGTCSPDLNYRR